MATTKIIIGLGNPGREYEKTRHNLGTMALLRLAKDAGVEFKKCRYASAVTAEIKEGASKVLLAIPLTYMNHSGFAVRDLVNFEKLDVADVLVVCDDIRLDFGVMRLRPEGSDGGHNGLRSIIAEVGSNAFARLKLGVGAPPSAEGQADYVLSNFNAREAKELDGVTERAAECCRLWFQGRSAQAMAEFNKRKDKKDNE